VQSLLVSDLAWLPDASGLILVGGTTPTAVPQLWQLSYPKSKLSRITNDLDSYASVSLTADAHTLAAVQNDLLSNLCVLRTRETSRA